MLQSLSTFKDQMLPGKLPLGELGGAGWGFFYLSQAWLD